MSPLLLPAGGKTESETETLLSSASQRHPQSLGDAVDAGRHLQSRETGEQRGEGNCRWNSFGNGSPERAPLLQVKAPGGDSRSVYDDWIQHTNRTSPEHGMIPR